MTTEWRVDHDELKRETVALLNEMKAELQRSRERRERRRRRLRRLSLGLLGR